MGGLGSQLFIWAHRHGHGGTIDTSCVCVDGEGALVPAKWEASVFTVWGTSVSAEGVILFYEGSGTVHHGGGHHSYIVGVWGYLVRVVGPRVLFQYGLNQNQVIYWTQEGGGCFLVLFQNH